MSKKNQAGENQQGMGNTPICVFTVSCESTDKKIVEHKIIVFADGTVDTNEHINETWGLDGQIIESLGGEADNNPCTWWAKDKTPNEVLEFTIWDNGLLKARVQENNYYYFNTDELGSSFSYDVLTWEGTQLEEWTEPAYVTVLLNLGIIPPAFWSDYSGTQSFDGFHSATLPLTDLMKYLRIVAPHSDGTIFFAHLFEEAKLLSPEELECWIEEGIPWDTVAAYKYENLDAETAGAIKKAVDYRKEYYGPYNKIGQPEYWAQNLIKLGMSPNRIAPFIERTYLSGMLYWRQEIFDDITSRLSLEQFPLSWIVEAVASIPDRDTLIDYAYAHDNQTLRSGEWTRAWANTVMPTKIIQKLQTEGNPAFWVQGWEMPTASELEINYDEMETNE